MVNRRKGEMTPNYIFSPPAPLLLYTTPNHLVFSAQIEESSLLMMMARGRRVSK